MKIKYNFNLITDIRVSDEDTDDDEEGKVDTEIEQSKLNELDNLRNEMIDIIGMAPRSKKSIAKKKILNPILKKGSQIIAKIAKETTR